MQRDYRLAMYALSISTLLLVASGTAVIAGANLSSGPAEDSANETITQLDADQHQQLNGTVAQSDDSTYTLEPAQRTCSGALRLNSPDHNNTSHQIGNVTVTLVSHHDGGVVDEIGRQQFVDLVTEATGNRAGLDGYSHLEVQVNQYYQSTAREDPRDIAGIHVRPVDSCLPSVRGTVNGTNETVVVQTVRSDIDEVSLNYTDEVDVLDQDDRELIERLVVADKQTSYNVRAHLDVTTLQATVTEATADDHVNIKLQRPDGNGSTVMLTVDLDAETVVHSWVEIQIDESNIQVVDANDRTSAQNGSEQSDSVEIDFDESNVTVVNDTSA